MRKLIYILISLLCLPAISSGAAISYYFSNTPAGAENCLVNNPCAGTMGAGGTIQALIDGAAGDPMTLYFDRGDTWSMTTGADAVTVDYGLVIGATDPVVHIDAYGAGDKPIWDGGVSDHSSALTHGTGGSGGPKRWNNVLRIHKDYTTVKNIRIQNVYGRGIWIGINIDNDADHTTVESCDIIVFGTSAIFTGEGYTQYSTFTKNLIHTGGQLSRFGKDGLGGAGWTNAIVFTPSSGTTARAPIGNVVSYNVIYDMFGEGVAGIGFTLEYNIIGDTSSAGVLINPKASDGSDVTIRYNLFVQSSGNDYDDASHGIFIDDNDPGNGDNSNMDIDVYGNVLINRERGIWIADGDSSKRIRVWNNTVIDSKANNFVASVVDSHDEVLVHNNLSIHYDRLNDPHVAHWSLGAGYGNWTIDNNQYYPVDGDDTVLVEWDDNYVTTDPKLYGEESGGPVNWIGQAAGDPRGNINFYDVYPEIDSTSIGEGDALGYEDSLLTLGTNFSVLPSTQAFATSEQTDLVAGDIGAAIRSLSYDFNINDGDINVATDADLNWTNQGDTTGVDGYFDVGSCPIGVPTKVIDDSLVATYDPTLTDDTTYCFTIDPHNSLSEIEAGIEIEFTTTEGPPPPVAGLSRVLYSPSGLTGLYDNQGATVGE